MKIIIFNKYFQSLLLSIFGMVLFLSLFLIDSIHATDFNKAQTSKSGIVDMFEVLPEYLQVDSTAENRDFHIKRNERSLGSGTQYYFYFEGGTLTVSMTTDGVFRIGSTILGSSTTGNASYPINLSGGTETTGVLPESQGGFGTSTPKYVRQNDGSSTGQLATNVTIAGTGTDTATMRTGGVDISPTEKSYLDGLTSNIQTQINTLGTSTPTANSIVRTGSGTTTIESEWIPNTIILNNLTQITTRNYDDVAGTSTIKPTQVAIGTSTLQGALNAVGTATFSGTVTAGGFSGNGAGLTGISVTVAFSEVTGSATSAQLPLISGLLGSATSAQLPTVLKLYGTTTEQTASGYGQLYMLETAVIYNLAGTATVLGLHMDNPGTSTFADFSNSAHTVTANGDAIGSSTAKFGSGALGLAGGTTGFLTTPDSNDYNFGNADFTIDFWVNISDKNANRGMYGQTTDASNYLYSYWGDAGNDFYPVRCMVGGVMKADYKLTSWSPTYGLWYHIEIARNGTTVYLFIDGVSQSLTVNTAISTNSLGDYTGLFNIGRDPLNSFYMKGGIDEFRISKGIARHTSNFTPPIVPYNSVYTRYSAKYADPVNGNTVVEILTHGTASTEASYIYNNATTTVFGLGTNTAITGTTTAYSGWFDGAVRATAFNVASTEKIKDNIKDIKIKPDLLDAEGFAKQNYIANSKIAWIAANGGSYTTVINETGTGSVIIVDADRMESDYNNYIELEWVSDLNQNTYTENIQKTYEKGFWQMFDSVTPKSWNPKDKPSITRKGFVVEDMPAVVKGDDGQSIDPMALIAYISLVQQTLKADTIFALSTLKELITTGAVTQQKIDYCNDRLEVLNP